MWKSKNFKKPGNFKNKKKLKQKPKKNKIFTLSLPFKFQPVFMFMSLPCGYYICQCCGDKSSCHIFESRECCGVLGGFDKCVNCVCIADLDPLLLSNCPNITKVTKLISSNSLKICCLRSATLNLKREDFF